MKAIGDKSTFSIDSQWLFCYYFSGIYEGKIKRRNNMARKLGLIVLMGALISVGCLLLYQKASAGEKPYIKDDEVIVSYRPDIEVERIEQIAEWENTEIVYRSAFSNFLTLKFNRGKMDLRNLIERLKNYDEIVYAEPNGIAYLCWTPNDPYFSYQWHLDNSHLNMELAWDVERGGSSSVIVGILDTGVAFEDYAIPSHEVDSVTSGDGYYHRCPDLAITYFVQGYDAVNLDGHPNDMNGHGTHCAGTVAQSTNNAKGVAGMAFNVSIMPVKVLGAHGSGTCDQIADGIHYAYLNGADVISMSLGGAPGDSTGFGTVHQAIIDADNAGTVVVAAAGNSAQGELSYPAGYEECIAVGATDIDDLLAPYSQWGEGIDVVAPGGDLNDTIPGTQYPAGVLQSTFETINDGYSPATVDTFVYMFLQGTSMATPHVAGLAALMISHGITGPSAIKQAMYSTCTDLGSPGYDLYFGYGLINPALALGANVLFTSMPILQNPYAQQFIDIWVVPEKPVYNDMPDTCRVTLAGSDTYLNFEKVAEQTYRTDYFFRESGTATIYVTARDDSTMTKGAISRQFSVTAISDGGIAESADGVLALSVPPRDTKHTSWIVISRDEERALEEGYIPLSSMYRCGPEGNAIGVPSVLRISFNTAILSEEHLEDIGIYRIAGDDTEYFSTEIDAEKGYAYVTINRFGTYVLLSSPGSGRSTPWDAHKISLNCYPNPVTSQLRYAYNIPETATIDIILYDATGRRVKVIEHNSLCSFGVHTGVCDLQEAGLAAGIYFLRIAAKTDRETIMSSSKVILMK